MPSRRRENKGPQSVSVSHKDVEFFPRIIENQPIPELTPPDVLGPN